MDDDKVLPFHSPRKALRRRLHNFRRTLAAQQLPIHALGQNVMKINPPGQPGFWVAILQVATRNLSTCGEAEQERALYHLFKFLNGRTEIFQWRFSSRPVDPQQMLAAIHQRLQALPEHDERRAWLQDHEEHIRTLVRINNIPEAGLYLVLRVPHPAGRQAPETVDQVAKKLQQLCTQAMSELHAVGVDSRRLNTWEMICLLWADMNPDLVATHKTPGDPNSLLTMTKPEGISLVQKGNYFAINDDITEASQLWLDLIAPIDCQFHRDRIDLNRVHRAVLAVRAWPTYLQYNALRHLTNSQLNLDISIHVQPVDTGEALRRLDERIRTLTVATAKDEVEGFTQDHRVLKFRDQAVYCREQLEQGHQRWFYTAMYVAVTADSQEQLAADVRTVETLLNQADIKAAPALRQQKEGFLACLPIGYDPVEASRNMLTDAVAHLAPLDAQQLMHPAGMYAGVSRLNNSLISLDVWALKNYNLVVLGVPGSGKTMWLRTKIQHVHTMTDDDQVVLDPDGEMDSMITDMGGVVVRLGGSSAHRINIMDLALDWDDERGGYKKGRPLDKFIPLLTSWLEYQIGVSGGDGRRRFDPVQKAHVMHAIIRAYGRYGITPENQSDILAGDRYRSEAMPVLDDLQEELRSVESSLAEAMDLFRFGPMQLFNARTNVDLTGARLISLNLRELDPATRNMAMPWMVNWVWARVGLNRYHKRNTHLYFEEILWFLQEPIAAEYISMIWTRGRKWRCCPAAVSQLLERLMATEVGRTIVKTSDLKVLFDQGEALPEIQAHCGLSDAEASFVKGSSPGKGLYVLGPYRLPFLLLLSAYQYDYFTTRPGEMKELWP
ncbi:MAG TPA: SCO6880 family protein [Symbiobacteriaceae bacterium]|nr:SCO6880 family protein [Symbiobacteriaceae bacterium]